MNMFTEKQKELIELVKAAKNCAGSCNDYCYGCIPSRIKSIRWAAKQIDAGKISSDILEAARVTLV